MLYKNLFFLIILLFFININKTFAQKDISKDTLQINQIDVIGQKKGTISGYPSDKIISLQTIRLQNSQTTADLIQTSGQVFVQKSQMGGGSPIIRGFEANKILLKVDGIRINNAIFRGGHLQNLIRFDPSTIQNIEIAFGPGATLHGSDALGGVLNINTLSPIMSNNKKSMINGSAFVRYGSANREISNTVVFGIAKKQIGFFTAFSYSNFGDLRMGAQKNWFQNDSISKTYFYRNQYIKRINNTDSIVQNPNPLIQKYSGYSQYNSLSKIQYSPSKFYMHTISLYISNSSNVPRYDRLTEEKNNKLAFSEWYYGPEKWNMIAYHFKSIKKTNLYDALTLNMSKQSFEESRNNRAYKSDILKNQSEKVDVYSIDLDIIKTIKKHEIIFGFESNYNKVNSIAYQKNIITNQIYLSPTRYPDGGSKMKNTAIYMAGKWTYSSKIHLFYGLRYTINTLNSVFVDKTFFPFPYNMAIQNNSNFSGHLSCHYIPSKTLKMAMVLSNAFRTPNVDDMSKVFDSNIGNLIIPNPNLKPEKTNNISFDLSKQFNKKFSISTSAYYTLLHQALSLTETQFSGLDSIEFLGVKSKVFTTANNNKAVVWGTFIALQYQTKDITLSLTFNTIKGNIISPTKGPLDHINPNFGKIDILVPYKSFKFNFYVLGNLKKDISAYRLNAEDNERYALPEGTPATLIFNFKTQYSIKLKSNRLLNYYIGIENILDTNYRNFASGISASGRHIYFSILHKF